MSKVGKFLDLKDKLRAVMLASRGPNPLSAAQLAVYVQLVWHQNSRTGRCNPSQSRLAAQIGRDKRTVQNAIAALKKRGLIEVKHTPRGTSSNYRIKHPDSVEGLANSPSQTDENPRPQLTNQASSKKGEKEKRKRVADLKPHLKSAEGVSRDVQRRQKAENDLFRAIAAGGVDMTQVLSLPTSDLEAAIDAIAREPSSLSEACKAITDRL